MALRWICSNCGSLCDSKNVRDARGKEIGDSLKRQDLVGLGTGLAAAALQPAAAIFGGRGALAGMAGGVAAGSAANAKNAAAVCPLCKQTALIPISTPIGKKLFEQNREVYSAEEVALVDEYLANAQTIDAKEIEKDETLFEKHKKAHRLRNLGIALAILGGFFIGFWALTFSAGIRDSDLNEGGFFGLIMFVGGFFLFRHAKKMQKSLKNDE